MRTKRFVNAEVPPSTTWPRPSCTVVLAWPNHTPLLALAAPRAALLERKRVGLSRAATHLPCLCTLIIAYLRHPRRLRSRFPSRRQPRPQADVVSRRSFARIATPSRPSPLLRDQPDEQG